MEGPQVGVLQKVIDAMSRVLAGLAEMPWGVNLLVALAMAAGIVLWLTGERLIKSMIVILIAMIGGVLGVLLLALTGLGASSGFTMWHGLGLGTFVGLVAGLLMYRSAIALSSGAVFGVMLPMLAAALLGLGQAGDAPLKQTELAPASVQTAAGALPNPAAMAANVAAARATDELTIPENIRDASERARIGANDLATQLGRAWGALPAVHRVTILLCAAVGLAGGVILGLSMPAWGCAATASGFGAAVWLGAFVWISNSFAAPWRNVLERPALHWLAIWSAVALVGLLVHWSGVFRKRGAKKAVPSTNMGPVVARAA
jgi:hypothetical protein